MPHPQPDELALAALPAEPPSPDTAAHLEECARCRAEVEALRHTVDLARTGDAVRAAPPPRVWEGILAELGSELGPEQGPDEVAPASVVSTGRPAEPAGPGRGAAPAAPVGEAATSGPRQPTRPRRSVWRRAALPAVAAAAGLLLGLALGSVGRPAPSPPPPVASAPLAPLPATAPGTVGEVRLITAAGSRSLVVEITDPTGEPQGGYLEAWLLGGGGARLYSLGALTPQDGGDRFSGTFRLPDDLPLEQFDIVDVSAEHYDGDPTHSGESLVRGTL